MNSISEIITQRRKELELSQLYIADVLGYSVQTISKWENGKSIPSLLSWGALAKILQIDLDALIDGKLKSNYNNNCSDNTFSSENFASNLRRQRKIRDMTQKELAKQLSISYQTLLAWEKGTTFPNVEQFKKLSSVLGLSYDELYFGENIIDDSKQDEKPMETHGTSKSKKVKFILIGAIVSAFVISASALIIWVNSKSISNNTSTNSNPISSTIPSTTISISSSAISSTISITISDTSDKIVDPESLKEIVNRPFSNGTIERYVYDPKDQFEIRTKSIVELPDMDLAYRSRGCDYKFASNSSILASFSGKVTKIESDYWYHGKCVWVTHESGLIALYASLGEISVNINDEIKSGDVIGTSGTSVYTKEVGTETLHFELGDETKRANPEKAYGNSINYLYDRLLIYNA